MVVWSLRLSTRPSVALEYATILSYVLQKDFVCTELLGANYKREYSEFVSHARMRDAHAVHRKLVFI